jgi:hypothetical protein
MVLDVEVVRDCKKAVICDSQKWSYIRVFEHFKTVSTLLILQVIVQQL